MNTGIKDLFLLPVLTTALGFILAGRVTAQTFTVLHSFTGKNDGADPEASLVILGGTLYGTAYSGGSSNDGTVFRLNVDGTGFTNLHNFGLSTNGASPTAPLFVSGTTLYGTTL